MDVSVIACVQFRSIVSFQIIFPAISIGLLTPSGFG
jgi:cytochrome bd-type quinol oxidase subunit 1